MLQAGDAGSFELDGRVGLFPLRVGGCLDHRDLHFVQRLIGAGDGAEEAAAVEEAVRDVLYEVRGGEWGMSLVQLQLDLSQAGGQHHYYHCQHHHLSKSLTLIPTKANVRPIITATALQATRL